MSEELNFGYIYQGVYRIDTRKLSVESKIFNLLKKDVEKSDCIKRKYAAVIKKGDDIIGEGYSYIPYGKKCTEGKSCYRENLQQKYGGDFEYFEICPIIHAEMVAILSCEKLKECDGATLYLLGIDQCNKEIHKGAFPCALCLRHVLHVGIREICIVQDEDSFCKYTLDKENTK